MHTMGRRRNCSFYSVLSVLSPRFALKKKVGFGFECTSFESHMYDDEHKCKKGGKATNDNRKNQCQTEEDEIVRNEIRTVGLPSLHQ